MNMIFPGNLVSTISMQTDGATSPTLTNQGEGIGEGQAFQLLFENFLFETITKELFQNKGGLLAGVGSGLFEEEEGEENQLGDNFLALLELLQEPLLEQLRVSQGENILGKNLLSNNFIGETKQEADELSVLNLLQEFQQEINQESQEKLNVFPKEFIQNVSGKELNFLKNEEQIIPPLANQNLEIEKNLNQQTNLAFTDNGEGRNDNLNQLFEGMNAQNIETSTGVEKPNHPIDLLSRVSYQDISEQIIKSGKLKLAGEYKEIELQLKPEYLGRLALKVTMENGILTARMLVENHQVGRMLEQNLHNLKQTLTDQGITLDQVHVEVGDPRSSFHEQHQEWQNQRGNKEKELENIAESELLEEILQPEEMLAKIGIDYRA